MSLFEDIEEMAKDEASIFTYQLVDGSYIMAEEVDYNFDQNVIYIINPVRIRESIKGDKFQLSTYMITEHSHPIQLRDDSIIASSPAPMVLRQNYFQYNLMSALKQSLEKDDFKEIVDLIFGGIDSTDDVKNKKDTGFDFNKPYKIKKIKDEENPWDRY